MAFDWREFLVFAHQLQNDQREGVQRTGLGRTYYYIYNLAIKNLNCPEQMPGLHKKLWKWCNRHSDRRIRQLGTMGSRMYSLRLDADYYDAHIGNLPGEVGTQILRAQAFETLAAQLNGATVPSKLGP